MHNETEVSYMHNGSDTLHLKPRNDRTPCLVYWTRWTGKKHEYIPVFMDDSFALSEYAFNAEMKSCQVIAQVS